MANSLSLRLYLATRARSDRSQRKSLKRDGPADNLKLLEQERLGRPGIARPDGPLIWVHSGQDRYALAAREFARRLQLDHGDLHFLFTTGADQRPESDGELLCQLAPDDTVPAVRRFLDHWRPDVALWTEPDMRPALVSASADRGVPLFFVDAHTAATETHGWRFWPGLSGSLLSRFERVITGDPVKAGTFRRMGADPDRIEIAGFLEEGSAPPSCNHAERDALSAELAGRPIWLAARVSDNEIEPVLEAHRATLRRAHRMLLILVPDDPTVGPELAEAIRGQEFTTGLRSAGDYPEEDTQIYLADTEGELGLWYRLAATSYLGRSMGGGGGGINPYEPAALGSAIIHGPNVRDFRRAYGRLSSAGATRMVRDAAQLTEAVEMLLAPDFAAMMAHEAWKVCSSGAEVTDRAMELILAELDALESA